MFPGKGWQKTTKPNAKGVESLNFQIFIGCRTEGGGF